MHSLQNCMFWKGVSVLEQVTGKKTEAQRGGVIQLRSHSDGNQGTWLWAHLPQAPLVTHLVQQLAPLGLCQDRAAVTNLMNHSGSLWAAGDVYTALPGMRTQHFLWVHPLPLLKATGLG